MATTNVSNPLPFMNVQADRQMALKRNIISFFVPSVGTINMFVNPESIDYRYKKIITPERTKGGYSIGYYGEELPELTCGGTTGSSGIEGINVLYEIYRAEQYLFDPTAMAINAANNQNLVSQVSNYIGQQVGADFGVVSNLVQDVTGAADQMNLQQLNSRNISMLGDVAFGIEMYYSGWIFRGFFSNFNVMEKAEFVIPYTFSFMVTQRRGYRLNNHPFLHSPQGPSQYESNYSYDPSYQISTTL